MRAKNTIKISNFVKRIKFVGKPESPKWIPCSERLPTREEYLENDGRFILDDGNRRYFGLFDIYEGKFKTFMGTKEDKCAIAWMSLPKAYKEDKQNNWDYTKE